MAGYGTVSAFAEELGESEHVTLLNETLEEEKEADEKLSALAGDINAKANRGEEAADENEKITPKKKSRNAA
jgi:ferritin-like metal-binding protein YciE